MYDVLSPEQELFGSIEIEVGPPLLKFETHRHMYSVKK